MKNCFSILAALEEALAEIYDDPIRTTTATLGLISNSWGMTVSKEDRDERSLLFLFSDSNLSPEVDLDAWSLFADAKLVFVGIDPFWYNFPSEFDPPTLAEITMKLPIKREKVISSNYLLCSLDEDQVAPFSKLFWRSSYGAQVFSNLIAVERLTSFVYLRKTLSSRQKITFFPTSPWSDLYALYDLRRQCSTVQKRMRTRRIRDILVSAAPVTHLWTCGALYELPDEPSLTMDMLAKYFSFHYVKTEKIFAIFRLSLLPSFE